MLKNLCRRLRGHSRRAATDALGLAEHALGEPVEPVEPGAA